MFNRRTLFKTIAVGALTPWNEVLTPLEESVSYVPECWAGDTTYILTKDMTAANIVHRDYLRNQNEAANNRTC